MGYFSNGSAGDAYRAQWCDRCANDGDDRYETGCGVWDLHLLYAYEAEGRLKEALDHLIPRVTVKTRDGLDLPANGQCLMFRERPGAPDPNQMAFDLG